MLKTNNTRQSPSVPSKQLLWNPSQDSQLKINLETQQIKLNGDVVDYDSAIITEKGLILESSNSIIEIDSEILLKFHNGRVAQRYCHELAKSISRMSHSTILNTKNSKTNQKEKKEKAPELTHCLPLISRIPAKTKYIIQVLRHLSTSKIQILLQDKVVFQYLLVIFSKASEHKDSPPNHPQKNIYEELSILPDGLLSETIWEFTQINELYRPAYERVFYLMKIFAYNHALIGFLSDLNVCLVSKKISEWVSKGLLTVQGNIDRKTRRATQNNKQAIQKLQNIVKIIRSAMGLIGSFRKAASMLNEIVMIDEVHHWISAEIDNISKNEKARKILVELLGLICLINKNFAGKLYSEKQKSINFILTTEIMKYYDQRLQEKCYGNFLESLLQIADEASNEKNQMPKKKSLGMMVIANFIEMLEWVGIEELLSIASIFKSNYEAVSQLGKPLSNQITKKLSSLQKLNIYQRKKHRILLVELYKLILILNQSSCPINKSIMVKLQRLKGNNEMLCNIYARINSEQNPIKIQDHQEEA